MFTLRALLFQVLIHPQNLSQLAKARKAPIAGNLAELARIRDSGETFF